MSRRSSSVMNNSNASRNFGGSMPATPQRSPVEHAFPERPFVLPGTQVLTPQQVGQMALNNAFANIAKHYENTSKEACRLQAEDLRQQYQFGLDDQKAQQSERNSKLISDHLSEMQLLKNRAQQREAAYERIQNKMEQALRSGRSAAIVLGERLQEVDQNLKDELYEKEWHSWFSNGQEKQCKTLENGLKHLRKELESERRTTENLRESLKREESRAENLVAASTSEKERMDNFVAEVKSKQVEVDQLIAKLEIANGKITTLADVNKKLNNELTTCREAETNDRARLEEIQTKLDACQKSEEEIRKDYDGLQKDFDACKRKMDNQKTEITNLNFSQKREKTENARLQDDLNNMTKENKSSLAKMTRVESKLELARQEKSMVGMSYKNEIASMRKAHAEEIASMEMRLFNLQSERDAGAGKLAEFHETVVGFFENAPDFPKKYGITPQPFNRLNSIASSPGPINWKLDDPDLNKDVEGRTRQAPSILARLHGIDSSAAENADSAVSGGTKVVEASRRGRSCEAAVSTSIEMKPKAPPHLLGILQDSYDASSPPKQKSQIQQKRPTMAPFTIASLNKELESSSLSPTSQLKQPLDGAASTQSLPQGNLDNDKAKVVFIPRGPRRSRGGKRKRASDYPVGMPPPKQPRFHARRPDCYRPSDKEC